MSKLPKKGMVGSLFAGTHTEATWKAPTEFPDFSAYAAEAHFGFDTETDSKDPHKAKPVGLAVCTPDDRRYYFPFGHRGGGNLDEGAVKRWAAANLARKHLSILNAKYDVHVCHNWGLDLEGIGSQIHDPAFKAALLDENRRRFNLDLLSQDLLGLEKSATYEDKSSIADSSAAETGEYAEHDAYLHLALDLKQQVDIDKQDLSAVCELEDNLIYSTVEMEHNGGLIDRPKLERWVREVSLAHETAILQIHHSTGMKVNPNSIKDMARLFDKLGLEYPRTEPSQDHPEGEVTFEEEYLGKVTHPDVRACMAAKKLDSLNSKYLKKYLKALDSNNILRYDLHQLRGDEYGTVTGRYASANLNIQQVMKVESQLEEEAIAAWIVRELFIPAPGCFYVSADASQIEFRWFAHYSGSARLIQEYCDNPHIDFHQLVADMLSQKRKDAKHNNFGKVYGMGIEKLARKLGYPCNCGCDVRVRWDRRAHRLDCKMQTAFDIAKNYDERFPEAKRLLEQASKVAKKRGYVRTVMGRRRRYPDGTRLHSALNAVIQGTAADTFKVKCLETYRNRKFLEMTMRAPVHDELDGDLANPDKAVQFKELLEAPDARIPCRVPLLWDVEVGANWRVTTE